MSREISELSPHARHRVSGHSPIPADFTSAKESAGRGSWDCFRCTGQSGKRTCLGSGLWLTHEQYVTLLPKSITTAIGLGVSEELGGITTITVAVIIVTGVLGNVIGELVCRLFRIHEPIAVGLALGTSAHAIGTTKALELGEVQGAMSSLSIAVAGLLTVILGSVFAQIY